MSTNAVVAGVGMIPFTKPGQSEAYNVMGEKAARAALADSTLSYEAIQQAYVGYVYGDSTCGQSALYPIGLSGIPILNVNNNCSTGSSALFLARQAVESGMVDCALALGFEQMNPGALGSVYTDRPAPLASFVEEMVALRGGYEEEVPMAAQLFGGAGADYMEKYGIGAETFGKISVKARKHAANNPFAVFRDLLTLEEVMESKYMTGPLTRFQCCPPTCATSVWGCTRRPRRLSWRQKNNG